MSWTLDASVALAWVLPDERSPLADAFLVGLPADSQLWIPALWWYEVANALRTAQAQKRLGESDVPRAIELYRQLPLRVDTLLGHEAMLRWHMLAAAHDLSVYDAAYLELAQRKGLGLASLDQRLNRTAKKLGVRLWP
jgi:predicted nucleic acid-binding protein